MIQKAEMAQKAEVDQKAEVSQKGEVVQQAEVARDEQVTVPKLLERMPSRQGAVVEAGLLLLPGRG
jgi:hypothetical protein